MFRFVVMLEKYWMMFKVRIRENSFPRFLALRIIVVLWSSECLIPELSQCNPGVRSGVDEEWEVTQS